MIHGPSYWEGRVDVVGTHNGRPVKGLGYIEYAGLNKFGDVNTFFGKVGRVVRSEVKKMYPDELDFESGLRIVARPGQEHYLDGVDYGALKASLLDPVRLITDRGGKSWRSFAAIARCVSVCVPLSLSLSLTVFFGPFVVCLCALATVRWTHKLTLLLCLKTFLAFAASAPSAATLATPGGCCTAQSFCTWGR